MSHQRNHKISFWIIIGLLFLLSGGYLLLTYPAQSNSALIISEFLAGNDRGPVDVDGDYSDWIEIYNRSNRPVNLSGWSLTDDPDQPAKWTFPELTLGSHDYLLVFASGKNRKELNDGAGLHTNFKLSKTDQFLGLHNVFRTGFMDHIVLESLGYFRNVSYGRYQEAAGYFTNPTPGGPNDTTFIRPEAVPPVTTFTERPGSEANRVFSQAAINAILQRSPIRVTEIMYNPQGGSDYEFIELQNGGSTPYDLAGVHFEGIEFSFPYGRPPLAPNEIIVLVDNEDTFAERYPEVKIDGVFDGNLSNSGEQIILRDLLGNVVALVDYDDENG